MVKTEVKGVQHKMVSPCSRKGAIKEEGYSDKTEGQDADQEEGKQRRRKMCVM